MKKNHPLKYICVILCLMLAATSVPVFATEPTPSPTPAAISDPVTIPVNTPTPAPTPTPRPTDTPAPTNTPEPLVTNTPEPVATDTPEPIITNTPEPTATNTTEPEGDRITPTPEVTLTPPPEDKVTPTPMIDPDVGASPTPTIDPDASASPTPTIDPDASASPTPTIDPDASASPTPTIDPDASASPTPTIDPNATVTPTPPVMFGVSPFRNTTKVIKSFNALEPASLEVNRKPETVEVAAALLPAELGVTFLVTTVVEPEPGDDTQGETAEDGTGGMLPSEPETVTTEEAGTVPVTWIYEGDYAAVEEGNFVFTAQLPETGYVLDDENTAIPKFTLIVNLTLTFGDYQGRLNEDNELIITAWTGSDTSLTVPKTLGDEGYPVVGIADAVFAGKTGLAGVELSVGIETIGNRLFAGCTGLQRVVIPDSLQNAGSGLFDECGALKFIILRTEGNTTLTAADTFEYTLPAQEAEGESRRVSVKLPAAFTDIEVAAGSLGLNCDFAVAKEHGIIIASGASLQIDAEKKLDNRGTVSNGGTLNNNGIVITCGGTFGGNEPVNGEGCAYIAEHVYEEDVCTGCGAAKPVEEAPTNTPEPEKTLEPEITPEPITVTKLDIRYDGSTPSRAYDGTKNVTIKASDFVIRGIAADHDVRITGIKASYDSINVGSRTVKATLTLGGEHAAYYTCDTISIPARITPRKLTITPNPGQSKTFGAADPSKFTGKVRGLLEGDVLTGRLDREPGENAGQYRILQGTINGGNNYSITVAEVYFTINPKSVNSSDITLSGIGNQRYTGAPVMPEVVLRHGNTKLEEGRDFTVTYSNNVSAGTANVRVCGIGNYGGERTTSFRILKISSGVDYTGGITGSSGSGSFGGDTGSTGSSSGGYVPSRPATGFSPGADVPGNNGFSGAFSEETFENTHLNLRGTDHGSILFTDLDEHRPFDSFEEKLEVQPEGLDKDEYQWKLIIQPEPTVHEYSGEILYMEDGRVMYENLHLRISVALADWLRQQNCIQIVYQLEDAELIIPLEMLTGEVLLHPENQADTIEADSDGAEENTVMVELYDFCIQQVYTNGLMEREAMALQDYEPAANLYRVSIFGEISRLDAQGNDIVYEYPAMDTMKDVRLLIHPMDDPGDDLSVYTMVWVSDDPERDETDPEAIINRYSQASFVYENGAICAVIYPEESGLYALGTAVQAE